MVHNTNIYNKPTGILASDGIVLAAERRSTNKLLDEVFFSEKIYQLNEDMVCSVAGITSDANVLTNELRLISQRYLLQYGESIPCEQLVSRLCDTKQAYTQFGGKRPFGVSLLYGGWDHHYGFQLYQSDPSGNYGGWKGTCIGNNSTAAISILKQVIRLNIYFYIFNLDNFSNAKLALIITSPLSVTHSLFNYSD